MKVSWVLEMLKALWDNGYVRIAVYAVIGVALFMLFWLGSYIFEERSLDWEKFKSTWGYVASGVVIVLILILRYKKYKQERTSSQTKRLENATKILSNEDEAGMREARCHDLKELGQEDVAIAIRCRYRLIRFIQQSSPTKKQKEAEQEGLSRSDIEAADQALSSLYQKWWTKKKFTRLSMHDLPQWFWRKKSMSELGYPGINLSDVYFIDPTLSSPYLFGVDFRKANLSSTWFEGADLSATNLTKAKLIDAKLIDAKLIKAKLSGADLTGADLTGADLSGADLTGADLTGADLSGVDFIGETIGCADYEEDGARVFEAKGLSKKHIKSAYSFYNNRPKVPDALKELVSKMEDPPIKSWHYNPNDPQTKYRPPTEDKEKTGFFRKLLARILAWWKDVFK